jgi:hypothetical protein
LFERLGYKVIQSETESLIVSNQPCKYSMLCTTTSNSELSYELFTQVPTPHDKYPEQPNYALDKEKIDKIINILKKQYPLFYKQLLTAREGYTKEMTLLQD